MKGSKSKVRAGSGVHTSPTGKQTSAKERKVDNGENLYPRPDFTSLSHFTTEKPDPGNVHNGNGPNLTLT